MNQEGYGQAYEQGYRRTVRLLRSRGSNIDRAEDLAQAAWVRGWQKLDQLRDESMLLSWVNSIAINYHRSGKYDESRFQPLSDVCGRVGIDLAPLEAQRVLTFCGHADQALFELQLCGLTTEEIADRQGVSATTIRVRLFRARRAVRENLHERSSKLRIAAA
jgi:RNA polymerase sigma-70 factor (ECF subfamily)